MGGEALCHLVAGVVAFASARNQPALRNLRLSHLDSSVIAAGQALAGSSPECGRVAHRRNGW